MKLIFTLFAVLFVLHLSAQDLLKFEVVAGNADRTDCSANRMQPEPMRVWPEDQNGRGDVYFEFCPIRHKDWKLEKGNDYTLRYRLVIFDGKMTPEEAEDTGRHLPILR